MINCQNPDYLSYNPSETYQKSKFNHQSSKFRSGVGVLDVELQQKKDSFGDSHWVNVKDRDPRTVPNGLVLAPVGSGALIPGKGCAEGDPQVTDPDMDINCKFRAPRTTSPVNF